MKHKSMLVHFAAVALQALFLALPDIAFATVDDEQEIGVPQGMETREKGCFGAVLPSDGDHFYTVREGLLTQYQINPFEKIRSIAFDHEQLKEGRYENCTNVWITNDKSKIIIVYRDRMFLLNAKTGQVLKKFEKLYWDAEKAILNENELVVLHYHVSDQLGRSFDLSVWDVNTFELKREVVDLNNTFGFKPTGGGKPGVSKILERIYLATEWSLVVLNSRTYAPELSLAIKPETSVYQAKHLFAGITAKISKDFRKLYVPYVTAVTDHINDKNATYEIQGETVLIFDQEVREARIEKMSNVSREELDPVLFHPAQLSRNKEYVMVATPFLILANLNTVLRYRFRQYESGAAILFDCKIGGQCEYFQLTPDARKYLNMKTSAGKIVPINDATFNKFYRAEGWK